MTVPFIPHQKPKMIEARISAKEASLIKILRKYSFGQFIVHKANNVLVRVVVNDSQIIDGRDGLDLAIE